MEIARGARKQKASYLLPSLKQNSMKLYNTAQKLLLKNL